MKRLVMLCIVMMGSITVKAQHTGYQLGDLAADFKLKNVNEKMVSLTDYKDAKGYILVFTCNTCPVSRAYEDRVEGLHKMFAAKGYPVVAINTNDPIASPGDSFDQMQERAKSKKFTFAYLEDPNHVYTKKYGANKTPHVFVLQKTAKGNEVVYIGAIDNDQEMENPERDNYVQNAINQLLKGEKPTVGFTKAIGCSIKWKKAAGK